MKSPAPMTQPRSDSALGVIVIMLGVTLGLVLGVYFLFSRAPSKAPTPTPPAGTAPPVALLHADWARTVLDQANTLKQDATVADIQRVRESIFRLRVTSADRDSHLAIVVDLMAWERGEAGAFEKLQAELQKIQP